MSPIAAATGCRPAAFGRNAAPGELGVARVGFRIGSAASAGVAATALAVQARRDCTSAQVMDAASVQLLTRAGDGTA